MLHDAIAQRLAERPSVLFAVVLLPDHTHNLWRLPPTNPDHATRMAAVKAQFTRGWRGERK